MKWLLMALSMLLMPYTLDAQIIKGALSFGLHSSRMTMVMFC